MCVARSKGPSEHDNDLARLRHSSAGREADAHHAPLERANWRRGVPKQDKPTEGNANLRGEKLAGQPESFARLGKP